MNVSKRRLLELSVDLCLVVLASYLAWVLRLATLALPAEYRRLFLLYLAPLVLLRLTSFAAFRLYHVWWRYVGLHELRAVIMATTLSSLLFVPVVLTMTPHYPLSVPAISWMLT